MFSQSLARASSVISSIIFFQCTWLFLQVTMNAFICFINLERSYFNHNDNSTIITKVGNTKKIFMPLQHETCLYYLVLLCFDAKFVRFVLCRNWWWHHHYTVECQCTYRFSINKRHKVDRKISHNTTQFTGVRHSFSCRTQYWWIHGGLGHRETPASERRGSVNLWRIWSHYYWYACKLTTDAFHSTENSDWASRNFL